MSCSLQRSLNLTAVPHRLIAVPELLTITAAAASGALLGALGPLALVRLPEPVDPDTGELDPEKTTYAELARTPKLPLWLGVGSAIYAGLAAAFLPDVAHIGAWVLLGAFGVLLAFVDAKTHLLPRFLVWPLYGLVWLAMGVAALVNSDATILLHSLYGNLAVFGAFLVLFFVAAFFFRGGFGYGDVRLSAVLGVVLGPLGLTATFIGIYAGFVLGAVVGVVRNRGRLRGQPALAFGPFMILGALAALFF